MYYKKLKQMITKKQQASQAVTLEPKKEEPKTRSSSSISAMTNGTLFIMVRGDGHMLKNSKQNH